jgi:hypothetical protein
MENTPVTEKERKPYEAPQIIHEIELETKAGSPLGSTDELFPPELFDVDR